MQIAIRELKSGLSRILSLAQGGAVIEVTSHSKPVARITGIPPLTDEGLRRLAAAGGLSWSGSKPRLARPLALVTSGTAVSQMVQEDRE